MDSSRALIVINSESVDWVESVFGKCNLWLLKFGEKNILDYYIDFLIRAGFEKIRVVSSIIIKDIEAYLTKKYTIVSFFMANDEDSIYDIIKKNSNYLKDSSRLAVISGFYKFVYPNSNIADFFKVSESFLIQKDGSGFMFFSKDKNSFENIMQSFDIREVSSASLFNIEPINSVRDYFKMCMELNDKLFSDGLKLKNRFKFFFVYLMAISDSVGDSSADDPRIERSLIFPGSFISKNARIVNSILCEDSYIPEGMKIENSVVVGTKVVGVNDGSTKETPYQPEKSDFFLFSHSPTKVKIVEMCHKIWALIFFALLFVPYTIFTVTPLKKSVPRREKNIYTNSGEKKIYAFRCLRHNAISKIFFILSLDLFQLLKLNLKKELSLIGQSVVVCKSGQRETELGSKAYHPGVFPDGYYSLYLPNHHRHIKSGCSFLRAFSLPLVLYFKRLTYFFFL